VTFVAGDVLDPAAVARVMRRTPVIATLGGAEALAEGMQVIVDAMKARGERRILSVVGAGVMHALLGAHVASALAAPVHAARLDQAGTRGGEMRGMTGDFWGVPSGIRTRVTALKGPGPGPD
jgi:hypothetical protein